mmetsp:Transcript_79110/g.223918  ORF Transcript_79110/g.223918 Transcript_79110/m.223918 type:complete len:321 (+) Transcript_79110:52-1014(+)
MIGALRCRARSARCSPPMCTSHARRSPGEFRLLCIVQAYLDVALKVLHYVAQARLLALGEGADRVDLLDALGAEGDPGGEVVDPLDDGRLHEGVLHGPLPGEALQHRVPEARAGVGHGEGRGALGPLRLDDHAAGLLDALDDHGVPLGRDLPGHGVLREDGEDRGASVPGVAPHDGHVDPLDRRPGLLMHELVRAHGVERRDAADPRGVEAGLLVQFGHGWHDRAHRVHDEADGRVGAVLRARLHHALRDVGVDPHDLAGASVVAWHPGRHEHQGAPREAVLKFIHGLLVAIQRVRFQLRLPLDLPDVNGDALRRHARDR